MIKQYIQTVLLTIAIGFLIWLLFFNQRPAQKDTRTEDSLKNELKLLQARNIVLNGDILLTQIHADEHKKKAEAFEKENIKLLSARVVLKQEQPKTEKDSLIKYVALDVNCDSILAKSDSTIAQFKKEATELRTGSLKKDTVITNLSTENKILHHQDSTHIELAKKEYKRGLWKGRKQGGVVGFLAGLFF